MKFFMVYAEFEDSEGNVYLRECTLAGETTEVLYEQILEFALDILRTDGLMLKSIIEMRRL